MFFCHGYKRGIQLGFDLSTIGQLVDAVKTHARNDLSVCFYACDCGRDIDSDSMDDLDEFGGDGGFADEVRDALCRAGIVWCDVYAHTTAGRADANPNVRLFQGTGSPSGGVGGFYIVRKGSKLWPKWRKALRTGDFRWRMPFMSVHEIHAELSR